MPPETVKSRVKEERINSKVEEKKMPKQQPKEGTSVAAVSSFARPLNSLFEKREREREGWTLLIHQKTDEVYQTLDFL